MRIDRYDFLVIGSGLAGLLFALKVAAYGRVAVVTKREGATSSTREAQGGIASVSGPDDSLSRHRDDTVRAGGGLCDRRVVEFVVGKAPGAIELLERLGVEFARREAGGAYDLGREGGHSRRRVLHAEDATGRAIEAALLEQVRAEPRIRLIEHCCAVDLITTSKLAGEVAVAGRTRVLGAYVIDARTGKISALAAPATVLATGGCGKVYRYTSNPDVATGDGLAMAYRAGARLANLEFVQFHPTCLYHPREKRFLISEAVRGEGALVRAIDGERFMDAYHPQAELAPRDVVARAIDQEMKRRGDRHVLLDLSPLAPELIQRRFPNIYATCLKVGIDITTEPVPVVPAAHYMCGGVVTDGRGRTDLVGLYAAGEVACTGLHGANRLASNSLVESAVFALEAATAAGEEDRQAERFGQRGLDIPAWDPGSASVAKESILVGAHWEMVRAMMWDFVGIVRNDHRLGLAAHYVQQFRQSIEHYYWDFILDSDLVELRNIALLAELIIAAARARPESRGLHFNADHPECHGGAGRDTVIDPLGGSVRPALAGELPFGRLGSRWGAA
ncbi:MAG: L-aspartate oxidase [Candidatus Eisenbacteria sp.]|nr:L-aspartate oxidase [Candidatus Eisenbacteria bacterium]